jgi:hypothetical protein
VSIKSLWGDFGDISGLRKLNPKVGYDLELIGEISSIPLDCSQPLILRFPILALRGRKGSKEGALVHGEFCS